MLLLFLRCLAKLTEKSIRSMSSDFSRMRSSSLLFAAVSLQLGCLASGICICSTVYSPVCGTDNVTYPNSCRADCNLIPVACNQTCPCPSKFNCQSKSWTLVGLVVLFVARATATHYRRLIISVIFKIV